jgi:hypothetical protein
VQTKLTVGPADDVYEREADRVAERVTRLPDPGAGGEPGGPGLVVQRTAGPGPGGPGVAGGGADAAVSGARLREGGRPLSASTRRFMEPRFGADFGGVRVHTGPQAERTAAGLEARAFTYGSHIWFGESAGEGDRGLVAHELTHVVQQGGAPGREDRSAAGEPAADRPRVQRTPRTQCPNGTKTLTIDMVSLEGTNHDPIGDLAFANTVFRPCCVQFQLGVGVSATSGFTSTALGGDTDLAREHSCSRVHAEEDALRTQANSSFGLGGRFRAFFVETMTPSERGVSFRSSDCGAGVRAPFVDHLYVANIGAQRTLAHELGHLLLNTTVDDHTAHPGGTDNLLEPTNTATGSNLEPSQCATIFANA